MSQASHASKDMASGAIVAAIGVLFLIMSYGYNLGTSANIGPGFFPTALSIGMILLGFTIMLSDTGRTGKAFVAWKPFLIIFLSIVSFGLMIERVGLLISVFVLVFASVWAHPEANLRSALAIAAGITALSVAIFHYALGISADLLPAFIGG